MILDKPLKLSTCLIVRDNARTLPACLESIRPWTDELVVVDTGSRDDTPEIARRFGRGSLCFLGVTTFRRPGTSPRQSHLISR